MINIYLIRRSYRLYQPVITWVACGLCFGHGLVACADEQQPPSIFAGKKQISAAADTTTTPPRAPVARSSTPARHTTDYVMRLDVRPQAGQDLEEAYYHYLTRHQVHPKVLRAKVRQIVSQQGNAQRQHEVVALLRAALRSGQVQPWMYEALGLAMELSEMPGEEVERTLLSAADFTNNPTHLLYIAQYLERFGRYDRALQLLREVAVRAPEQTEAYRRGLELAARQEDDEALRWATLAILRRAWPAEQRGIQDRARRMALAMIEEMRQRGDSAAAQQFTDQLKAAMFRDVVIKATWVGQADLDLMVEEPGGTVCSYRAPRTTGGGVLVGDLNTSLERSAGEGFSETYVCPEGFSGTYRVLLRQVWGRIPTGKVSVSVWTHGGSPQQVLRARVIELNDDGAALLAFDLKDGRRTESLEAQQLANDLRGQLAVNRAVLAQQIDSLASSSAVGPQQTSSQGQSDFVIGGTPEANGRNVGFQPVIAVLPSGVTLSVNAVISADRRYVRITALPFFSNVRDVRQFNLIVGEFEGGADGDGGGVAP